MHRHCTTVDRYANIQECAILEKPPGSLTLLKFRLSPPSLFPSLLYNRPLYHSINHSKSTLGTRTRTRYVWASGTRTCITSQGIQQQYTTIVKYYYRYLGIYRTYIYYTHCSLPYFQFLHLNNQKKCRDSVEKLKVFLVCKKYSVKYYAIDTADENFNINQTNV